MRKIHTLITSAMLGIAAIAPPLSASAQQLMNESFDYPVGNLYGNANWWKYASNPNDPVQVVDESLSYPGYQDTPTGKAVKLNNTVGGQDMQWKFSDKGIKEGAIYYSALIKMVDVSNMTKPNAIMNLIQPGYSGELKDGISGTELASLYVVKGSSDSKFKLLPARRFYSSEGGLKFDEVTTEYDINTTYLIVVKYEFVGEVGNDDIVSLWVNPATTDSEPATPTATYTASSGRDASRAFMAFQIRQGGTATKPAPTVIVDEVRVAQSYSSLFSADTPSEPTPKITPAKKSLLFGNLNFIGQSYEQTVNVKASDLKGDISVALGGNGDMTASTTTITKAEAESAEGYNLVFTLTPKSTENYMETITLSSEGAESVKISAYYSPKELQEVSDLKTLAGKDPEKYGYYKYTGQAVVTYAYNKTYYMQDDKGGIKIDAKLGDFPTPPKVGDKVTGFIVTVEKSFGTPYALPVENTPLQVVAEGQTVEPKVATLAQLVANGADYYATLVKVDNVTFTESVGTTITAETTNPKIKDASGEGRMNILDETDVIGYVIPETAVNMTGIATSASSAVIAPRNRADIAPAVVEDPKIEAALENIYQGTAVDINTTVQFAKLKIKATALTREVPLSVNGTNAAMFSISPEKIPAGSSETEIIVSYTPTKVGKHTCRINIDPEVGEFYESFTVNAVCIDPANPPTITVEPATLPDFEAKVGEKQVQEITVTTKGLPDYGKAVVKGDSKGAFILVNNMLMKDNTAKLQITFFPKAEGEFTETIEFTALEAQTVSITVKGKTTSGAEPTDKEGDSLPLDASKPLTLLNEKFDGITESNKPLEIDGWKNLAMTGKRAWWGYQFKDDDNKVTERAAKVTAYDSFATESSECSMMLVTPALDFENAKTKVFTFRVMGNMLREEQTDKLELCYITLDDKGEMQVQPISIDMPAVADLNEEWQEYHVNLSLLNSDPNHVMSDVFFMGFRFNSTRGKDNSAVYYIDDVTYGRDDLAVLTPSVTEMAFDATVNVDAESKEITVKAQNATEPITLSIGGANKSKFDLTTKELPKEGGSFKVKFHSDQVGVHEAYVKIASRGAADVYVLLTVNNRPGGGVAAIFASETPDVTVYDLSGRAVKHVAKCSSRAQLFDKLEKGIYIIKAEGETSIQTLKVAVGSKQ